MTLKVQRKRTKYTIQIHYNNIQLLNETLKTRKAWMDILQTLKKPQIPTTI